MTTNTRFFESVNPYDGNILDRHQEQTDAEVKTILRQASDASKGWRAVPLRERTQTLVRAAEVLTGRADRYARMITLEMGKPIVEARAEVNKCALACRYYADHAAAFLADETIRTDAKRSFVRHDPIGTVLAIMPWNFPFWQVFRFAAPALAAGNTCLLKHAPNVFGCAGMIAEVFSQAGLPEGVFQNLIVHHDRVPGIIADDAVDAVTLTGSGRAGAAVAAAAGAQLKKTVLELGGSNAFVVLADADLDSAVSAGIRGRMQNAGQSCIAAKRFILVDSVYDRFVEAFTGQATRIRRGDPLDESTRLGPLARIDLAENLHRQVTNSIAQGAELLTGGVHDRCLYQPTVLGGVKPGMPAFDEETFGPVAAMVRAKDEEEAFRLSAETSYGLGLTVCTREPERILGIAHRFRDGALFVNEPVKSDPRLPFGGTGKSGYGRELGRDGMMEFVNRKTVVVG